MKKQDFTLTINKNTMTFDTEEQAKNVIMNIKKSSIYVELDLTEARKQDLIKHELNKLNEIKGVEVLIKSASAQTTAREPFECIFFDLIHNNKKIGEYHIFKEITNFTDYKVNKVNTKGYQGQSWDNGFSLSDIMNNCNLYFKSILTDYRIESKAETQKKKNKLYKQIEEITKQIEEL